MTCTRLHTERKSEAIRRRCETLGQGGDGAGGQQVDETDGLRRTRMKPKMNKCGVLDPDAFSLSGLPP